MLKISKAALLAAALSLSAAPGFGLFHAVAQDASSSAMDAPSSAIDESSAATDDSSSSAEDTTSYDPADLKTTISIPTITADGSSMDEAAIRDSLSGNFMAHAADFAKLSANSIAIPEITVTLSNTKTSTTTTITVKD